MRVVVDTHVLVSAAIVPTGRLGAVILHLRQGDFLPLYSTATLGELAQVLARPRIRMKYGLTDADIRTLIDLVLLRGEDVTPVTRVTVCRDPRDDVFLEVALAGKAERIVSGDDDLLTLHPFRGIPIITPAAFLAELKRQRSSPLLSKLTPGPFSAIIAP